jgi:hypothetical protein
MQELKVGRLLEQIDGMSIEEVEATAVKLSKATLDFVAKQVRIQMLLAENRGEKEMASKLRLLVVN